MSHLFDPEPDYGVSWSFRGLIFFRHSPQATSFPLLLIHGLSSGLRLKKWCQVFSLWTWIIYRVHRGSCCTHHLWTHWWNTKWTRWKFRGNRFACTITRTFRFLSSTGMFVCNRSLTWYMQSWFYLTSFFRLVETTWPNTIDAIFSIFSSVLTRRFVLLLILLVIAYLFSGMIPLIMFSLAKR